MKEQLQTKQQGFTLVELMAVIAIIGVLAAIALPMYHSYTAKTRHTAAVADISPGKTKIEINFTEGVGRLETARDIGLRDTSNNCAAITVSADSDTGEAAISCALFGDSLIEDKEVKLVRNADGVWSCESTASEEYTGGCLGSGQ